MWTSGPEVVKSHFFLAVPSGMPSIVTRLHGFKQVLFLALESGLAFSLAGRPIASGFRTCLFI